MPSLTIKELFEDEDVTPEMIAIAADIGPYWHQCAMFINDNWGRSFDTLSLKQQSWAYRILEDLVEKRIEGDL